jgi:MraZ protein
MFRGLNSVALDAKGRMAIPARYRSVIHDESNSLLVVTIDTEERCLLLYPYPKWEHIEEKLEALPSYNALTRRIQRLLIGHATELEMDRSGRILLPQLLRDYAGLDKSIMLVGQGAKFELWGESQWLLARDAWLAEGVQETHEILPEELTQLSL